jgi:hypothetical protein
MKLPAIDTTKCIARVANKANISEKTNHQAINLMNDAVIVPLFFQLNLIIALTPHSE